MKRMFLVYFTVVLSLSIMSLTGCRDDTEDTDNNDTPDNVADGGGDALDGGDGDVLREDTAIGIRIRHASQGAFGSPA